MAYTFEQVMQLISDYATAASDWDGGVGSKQATEVALLRMTAAIANVYADAQRYRSLQGKIDGASEPQ